MNCENCNNKHIGEYASGRFCSKHCAHAFSTSKRREETNAKIALALKGKSSPNIGKKYILSDEAKKSKRDKAALSRQANYNWRTDIWAKVPKGKQRDRILLEQNGLCAVCLIPPVWMEKPLRFHLDHISGNHSDNDRGNLRLLCPNCHYQTPTWGSKNASVDGRKRMLEALRRK